jgi:hypothetical protein
VRDDRPIRIKIGAKPGGGNLFFQLVNARYEKGAMILTSNRGFAEWGEVEGGHSLNAALLSFPVVKVMDVFLAHALLRRCYLGFCD